MSFCVHVCEYIYKYLYLCMNIFCLLDVFLLFSFFRGFFLVGFFGGGVGFFFLFLKISVSMGSLTIETLYSTELV